MGRQQRRRHQVRARQRQARAEGASAAHSSPQASRTADGHRTSRGRAVALIAGIAILVIAGGIFTIATVHGAPKSAPASHALANSARSPHTAVATPHTKLPAIDGISCGAEQLAYHIHEYLALYNNGKQVAVPALIGIPNNGKTVSCLYWIHVHYGDSNIIHVECPFHRTLYLGQFFDIWSATGKSAFPPTVSFPRQLRSASHITVFVNGKRFTKNYRSVPLTDHEVITLEIGTRTVPPHPAPDWTALGL